MYFIFSFANTMLQSVWVLYTGYRYGWRRCRSACPCGFVGVMTAWSRAGP